MTAQRQLILIGSKYDYRSEDRSIRFIIERHYCSNQEDNWRADTGFANEYWTIYNISLNCWITTVPKPAYASWEAVRRFRSKDEAIQFIDENLLADYKEQVRKRHAATGLAKLSNQEKEALGLT